MTTQRIVHLIDDDAAVRDAVGLLLRTEGFKVAPYDSALAFLKAAATRAEGCVVTDVRMPEMNGIEATRRILCEKPDIKVLALSMHSARRFVEEALSAGAKGYLLKDCASEELVRAIRTVAADETYLSPKVADMIVKDYMKRLPDSESPAHTHLSTREREVLQLIAEGHSTKEIAFALEVSIKTIETHRQQIMKKLNLHSVAALTRFAIREGLTPLE